MRCCQILQDTKKWITAKTSQKYNEMGCSQTPLDIVTWSVDILALQDGVTWRAAKHLKI